MSALTEKVAREHYPYDDGVRGRRCSCDARPPRYEELNAWHREHIAEVTERATEQAVRADVAAEIRATAGAVADYIRWYEENDARVWAESPEEAPRDILARLARIAEGKQP